MFKLLATSKQALGSHHNTTKEVASALKWNRGIAFISSILFVFILIVVLAVVCQLAKKMRFVTLDRWVEVSIYLLFGFYMLYCILLKPSLFDDLLKNQDQSHCVILHRNKNVKNEIFSVIIAEYAT